MAETSQRILLLGGGNMGAALLGGWLDDGLDAGRVTVVDPKLSAAMEPLVSRHGVRHVETVPDERVDVVLLAVKPQMMSDAAPALAPALGDDTMAISIAAGTPVATIARLLGERPIVRAMPNTPSLIGRGVTGAFANEAVDEAGRRTANDLLSASGPVEWVDSEDLIDAVTGVSGSGPAYIFYLAECLAAAGREAGLAEDQALRLAQHTIVGAGELMLRSDDTPATLRKNVTSPNGTTQAALDRLMDETDGLAPLVRRAVLAARDRARELAKD